MKGTAWIGLAALFLLALASKGQALEMFSSIGKYDYGEGGVLLPGTEITLLDQAGPGAITLFQFASEYDLYEEVCSADIFFIHPHAVLTRPTDDLPLLL